MTYDDIVSTFFAPATGIASPSVTESPARRLRDAVEPIATQGWWSRQTNERLAALGLGFFDGYVWGRAAALGSPEAAVVVATFGVFEPGLLSAVYEQGRSVATREDVLLARELGAAESLASVVSGADAAGIADPLLEVLGTLDGMGRPLFSALRGLPLPATPQGRLWRACELVREHRGDGHLAAGVALGLTAQGMNVLTEVWLGYPLGEYSGTRGFGPERLAETAADLETRGWLAGGQLTSDGRLVRDALEAATDLAQVELVAGLGSDAEAMIASASTISERLVGHAFPADPRKRAAG